MSNTIKKENQNDLLRCPECGALDRPEATRCWLCNAPLGKASRTPATALTATPPTPRSTTPKPPFESAPPVVPVAGPVKPVRGFSLASILLFVTLACVVLGLISIAPGVGIPIGILVFVAWVRTVVDVSQRHKRGVTTSGSEKVLLYLKSFASVVFVLLAVILGVIIALFAACWFIIVSSRGF